MKRVDEMKYNANKTFNSILPKYFILLCIAT